MSSSCFLLRRSLSAWIMHLSSRMFLTPQPFLEGMDFNFPFRSVIYNMLTLECLGEALTSLYIPHRAQGFLVEVRMLFGKGCFLSQTANHSGIYVISYLLQYEETGRQITGGIYYFFVPVTRACSFKNKWLLQNFPYKNNFSFRDSNVYSRV